MAKARVQSLRLIIGGDKNNTFEIRDGETLTVGRDPGCAIQLNHHSISPIHCRMDFKNSVLTIIDLDSRVGIYHGNKRKKRLELKGDSSIALGQINIYISKGMSFSTLPVQTKIDLGAEKPPALPATIKEKTVRTGRRDGIKPWLRRLPFLTLSLVVHLIVFMLVADLPYLSMRIFRARHLIAQIVSPEDRVALDDETEPIEKRFDTPEVRDQNLIDPLIQYPNDEIVQDEVLEPLPREIAISGLTPGRYPVSGLAGEGTARLNGVFSRGFKDYIEGLRHKGMDVAFVMDGTSSMLPFFAEAKRVVDQLISKLAAVVPNLRMAMVIYRDNGDDYITRYMELTTDRYEILNFLEDCEAVGGGDFPEAVYDGLNRAIQTLVWRSEAKKVIILLGDAPYHENEAGLVDSLLREFRRGPNPGVVNTVYFGPVHSPPTGNEKAALDSWKDIARLGGGSFSMICENEELIERLVCVAFHAQWKADLTRLLEHVQADRMARIIERKAKGGQVDWLLQGLKRVPVRSGIVEALIHRGDKSDLLALIPLLGSEKVRVETKWAALYILKKVIGKRLDFNPLGDVKKQKQELDRIREAINSLKNAPL